jgi:hypothetical protein
VHTELAEDAPQVPLDRLRAEVERGRDVLAGIALEEQRLRTGRSPLGEGSERGELALSPHDA